MTESSFASYGHYADSTEARATLEAVKGKAFAEGAKSRDAEIEKLYTLLDEVAGGNAEQPCQFDHNGDCQEHYFFGLEDQNCPYKEVRALLEAHNEA